jgi:hypothetical protein
MSFSYLRPPVVSLPYFRVGQQLGCYASNLWGNLWPTICRPRWPQRKREADETSEEREEIEKKSCIQRRLDYLTLVTLLETIGPNWAESYLLVSKSTLCQP